MGKIEIILNQYGYTLETVKKITVGHVNTVYHLENHKLVLKVAYSDKEKKEISQNLEAYDRLTIMRLDSFIPKIYERGEDFLLMEYLGDDFTSSINAVDGYLDLQNELKQIFESTLVCENDSSIAKCITIIETTLNSFAFENLSPGLTKQIKLFTEVVKEIKVKRNCFATWDLTPHNVFIIDHKLRIIDIKGDCIGVPIMGIAAFAGVARDVLELPCSSKGYDLLHNFCVNDLSSMLGMRNIDGKNLFVLGRIVQCLMGARFNISSNIEVARARLIEAKSLIN